jgi:hypothetical protein
MKFDTPAWHSQIFWGALEASGKSAPDIDLSLFHGESKGVSSEHLAIHPTRNHLYLMDLHSTSGTKVNSIPVTPGVNIELSGNDAVVLGKFAFMLRVFETPETLELSAGKSSPAKSANPAKTTWLEARRLTE